MKIPNATDKYTRALNRFKREMADVERDVPAQDRPLRSWPACPHVRQAELDSWRAMPSRTS